MTALLSQWGKHFLFLRKIESANIRHLIENTEAETQFSAVLCEETSSVGMTITEAVKNHRLLEAISAKLGPFLRY